ncbi:MAG: hypothetical protein ACK5IB_05175 [Qingshengfaniella sp.]
MAAGPQPGSRIAALTGDFIASRRHPADRLDTAFDHLGQACATLAGWHGASLCLTRFRGDGWQVVLNQPNLSLRSVLFIQASLLARGAGMATRVGCGLGLFERMGRTDLSDADGPALELAGQALDTMGRSRRIAVASTPEDPALRAIFALADGLARGWSAAQAEALQDALAPDPPTQSEIAGKLGITQQSVSDRLDAGGFWALRDALVSLETGQNRGLQRQ